MVGGGLSAADLIVTDMIYQLFISPIETIIDWVFVFFTRRLSFLGIFGAICGVSLTINFLALPIYNVADALQEKERRITKKLEYRAGRIKKAFKGDERFMMLSAYYRQNGYHPLYVLRSSLSILIEIPFFIAAYHYLSHSELLAGSSFWIFRNLGAPDALIPMHFGSRTLALNILPVIMTAINIVSGAIYTKDAPVSEKIQLYAMAAIFLVLLYPSPSGLVIYWILNNLFSLAKNLVKKNLPQPETAALPDAHGTLRQAREDTALLLFSGIALALLCGLVLPANTVASSPIEFSFIGNIDSPLYYIKNSLCMFTGLFVVWGFVIYKLSGRKVRAVLPPLFCVLLFCSLANAFLFRHDYGSVSIVFRLDNSLRLRDFRPFLSVLPLVFLALAVLLVRFAYKKKQVVILNVLVASLCVATGAFGAYKTHSIKNAYDEYRANLAKNEARSGGLDETVYHLSKDDKNVIVLFLDRAVNSFFPYALHQLPELETQFRGFTYYPNTLSLSTKTTTGAPSMLGGYEYTPAAMNARMDEPLREKHNEASLVMPRLFLDAGFGVTVTDPPWPNYRWQGDLSAFEEFPGISVSELCGRYTVDFVRAEVDYSADTLREMKNFSVLQLLYPPFRWLFYQCLLRRVITNGAEGAVYLDNFLPLYKMPEITDFLAKGSQFIFIGNSLTHEPTNIDGNFEFPQSDAPDDFLVYPGADTSMFKTFVAAMKQTGKFLDYLRENGAYDNTRIIIVSDHGHDIAADPQDFSESLPSMYHPLLLLKDFDCNGPVATDEAFMTNADTLFLASAGLPVAAENPFTGKPLAAQKAGGVEVYPCYGTEWDASSLRNKTAFTLDEAHAWHVAPGSVYDAQNWTSLSQWKAGRGGEE